MLNIINGKTIQISTNECLNRIKELRKSGKVIVICPDRMALQVEEQIFDTLQVSSLFDVDVYTMTRLCSKVLDNIGVNKRILSKQLAVTLIKKIILENDLKGFKEVVHYNGFALKLFEIISMFKSSMVTPAMLLANTDNDILKEKLVDLNIVYENYEKFLGEEYTDSFNRLNLFVSSVTDEFKDTHILFVGFDDFTKQMYNIVNMFISKAKSVTIGTASSYGQKHNNKNIYVNNIFHSIIELCKTKGYMYHIDSVKEDFVDVNANLVDNLFGYTVDQYDKSVDSIKVVNFNDSSTEIDFVLKDIKYKVINNGLRYGKFSIAMPNLESRMLDIKSKFEEYKIPFFMDVSTTLDKTNLVRYILNFYETVIDKYRIDEFLNIIKDTYANVSQEEITKFEDEVKAKNISFVTSDIVNEYGNIKCIYQHMCSIKEGTLAQMIYDLRDMIETLGLLDKTNDIIYMLSNSNRISLAKDYKIAYEKLDRSLEDLAGLMPEYSCDIYTFVNILKAYFENVSVTIPPIIGDVVMVYDTNSSFIVKNDYMYMLSCVEGLVPKTTNDVSLILDKEINYFEENLRLSPTCDVINRRSKFKVFENVFKANKSLTITYYKSSFGGSHLPSILITSLHRCLPSLVEIDGDDYITNYGTFDNSSKGVFLLNNISENSAVSNLINLTKNFDTNFNQGNFNKFYYSLIDALPNKENTKMYLSHHTYDNTVQNIGNVNYFKNNKTSVSEIETYYDCPYKHFVKYGLKLVEKEDSTFKANDIGNLIHEFSSIIISKLVGELSDDDIKAMSCKILRGILESKYVDHLNNNTNRHVISNLYEECARVAIAIYRQQLSSKFKNTYNEKYFDNIVDLSTTVDGVTIYVMGFIDRIDICDDMFALIDYKTGGDKFSYTDLQSGKKLQLFIYVKAVNSMYDKLPVCTCYLPIRNDFTATKDNINKYKFKGVFSESMADLELLDDSFMDKETSNIGLNFKNDGNLDAYSMPYALKKEDIMKLADVAFDMVSTAVENILKGDISINPLYMGSKASACNRCRYHGLCNFDTLYQNKYRFVDKVATAKEILDKGDNE